MQTEYSSDTEWCSKVNTLIIKQEFIMKIKVVFLFLFAFIYMLQYAEITSDDVVYQIYPNCFYDTDKDGIGDLNGITSKLDYLKELGVTLIWLNPIYLSPFEHKYFADDFYAVDPELGTMEDFRNLCKEVHKRGMRILIDMETQYITSNHIWFKDSYNNPQSKYSNWVKYKDPLNKTPESIIGNILETRDKNGKKVKLVSLNMNNKEVLEYQKKMYAHWLDPNADGVTDDGVDGFRMDHIMDNLDYKGFATNLLSGFWKPIVDYTRTIKTGCIYIAEPADWGYGVDILTKADMDGTLVMKVRDGLIFSEKVVFDKSRMENLLTESHSSQPENKYFCTVLENHDTSRWATTCGSNSNLLKIGAVLTTMQQSLPHIYYGQELGQNGKRDLGNRDAFKWYMEYEKEGMASKKRKMKRELDVSLETQSADESSLFRMYKDLINFRKNNPAIQKGSQSILRQNNENVLSYLRSYNSPENSQDIIVLINVSEKNAKITIDLQKYTGKTIFNCNNKNERTLYKKITAANSKAFSIPLKKYEYKLLEIK